MMDISKMIESLKKVRNVVDIAVISDKGAYLDGTVKQNVERRMIFAGMAALFKTALRISSVLNGGITKWITIKDSNGYTIARKIEEDKILIFTANASADLFYVLKESDKIVNL